MAGGRTFKPDHLYIHDDGSVYCGSHIGTEATYMPHAWSDLGQCRMFVFESSVMRCENPRCENRGDK